MEKKTVEKEEVGIVIFWIMPVLDDKSSKKTPGIQVIPGKFPGMGQN